MSGGSPGPGSTSLGASSGPGADGGGIGGVGGQNSTGANGQPIPEESNLLTEFEFAYEEAVGTLIREDNVFDRSPETLQEELETKILKMSEVARKLETFFCQKRLLLHSHEPEYNLSDENQELKREILRKDELIRRHSDKLSQWQAMLSGQVQAGNAPGNAPPTAAPPQAPNPSLQSGPPMGGEQATPHQQPQVGVRPGAPLQPGIGAPQGGFVPGNNYRMINPANRGMHPGAHPPHMGAQMGAGSPLAYLEKTASSIGANSSPYGPNR